MAEIGKDSHGVAQGIWAIFKLGGSATPEEIEEAIFNFTFEDELQVLRVEQNVNQYDEETDT